MYFFQEDLFALEKESTPADLEAQREASRALQEELHAAVVARIKNRDNPPPVAVCWLLTMLTIMFTSSDEYRQKWIPFVVFTR